MSIDQEKNQIIKHFLSSFKNKELYLINFIIFYFKNYNSGPELCNNARLSLQNIRDLQDLKKLLENLLNQLNIFELRLLKNNKIQSNNKFLNISQIKKISNNQRFTNFIINSDFLSKKNQNKYMIEFSMTFILPELKLNDILNIQEIAIKDTEIEYLLTSFKESYSNLINNNKNLNKYIKNEDFLVWAYEYIRKKEPYSLSPATNFDEYKNAILSYFDFKFITNSLQYEKDIDALKKAWQQKQFRDQGKTKKEYHLPLTKQAKSELSDLAKFKNLNENSLLEELIHTAYLSEMCDENGKARY